MALWITNHVGSMGYSLITLAWTMTWLGRAEREIEVMLVRLKTQADSIENILKAMQSEKRP